MKINDSLKLSYRDTVCRGFKLGLEITDDVTHEIRRQFNRFFKLGSDPPVTKSLNFCSFRSIGEGVVLGLVLQGDGECCFHGRLVETREGFTGTDRGKQCAGNKPIFKRTGH